MRGGIPVFRGQAYRENFPTAILPRLQGHRCPVGRTNSRPATPRSGSLRFQSTRHRRSFSPLSRQKLRNRGLGAPACARSNPDGFKGPEARPFQDGLHVDSEPPCQVVLVQQGVGIGSASLRVCCDSAHLKVSPRFLCAPNNWICFLDRPAAPGQEKMAGSPEGPLSMPPL